MTFSPVLSVLSVLLVAPFLRTLINRTKAFAAGRQGPPLLLPYHQLAKLLGKGAVISGTTTWIFRAGPLAGLVTVLGALCLVPVGGASLIHFEGDLILFAYLLGLGRFFTILAALDTGSSFEGMGASREAFFSALTEPALLLGLGGLAALTGSASLSGIYGGLRAHPLDGAYLPALIFILGAFGILYLSENSRIPVDDPTTHLELTMIHEAMILDHCGVDLAMIEYAGALKLWILGLLVSGLLFPFSVGSAWGDRAISLLGPVLPALLAGCVESSMARLRLRRVPLFLASAFIMSALWVLWVLR
jgi:formate hydrogenlyase subunit 4